ncbi:hypothetical protein ACFE04_029642 [Oxalis oulophora]
MVDAIVEAQDISMTSVSFKALFGKGLLSFTSVDLEVLLKAGKPLDRLDAAKILPLLKNEHLLFCTLLIAKSLAMEKLTSPTKLPLVILVHLRLGIDKMHESSLILIRPGLAELVDPAVKGTLNVLSLCAKTSSIKIVVLTSSMAAVAFSRKPLTPDVVVDETWFSDSSFSEETKLQQWLVEHRRCVQIDDINLNVGTGSELGESIIKDVKGIEELKTSLSSKEYQIISECALTNISETPHIIPSLKKDTEAPSSDAIKSVVVNLIELCLCTGEGRDASMATVQVYICFFSS